jgi:hypothetical protein
MTTLLSATSSLAATELARLRRLTADTIRGLAMDGVQKANSGHPGMPMGMADEATFAREEVGIPLKCNVHSWMHSYLAVFKHPYFAVTGKDGSFDLSYLPPGTYTTSAWQEKLGTVSQKITVGSDETKTLQFVFKSKTGS